MAKQELGRLLLHFIFRKCIVQKYCEPGEEKDKSLEMIDTVLLRLMFKFAKTIDPDLEEPPGLMGSKEPIEDPVALKNLDTLTKQILDSDPISELSFLGRK